MKGLIFTEFLELVEDQWGMVMLDKVITDAQDPTDGAYNAVDYYPHSQLVNLVLSLSRHADIPAADLMRIYGKHLFGKLAENNPSLIAGISSSFEMLENIELVIHTEVRKLYPESNPPRFTSKRLKNGSLLLTYHSHRSMADVAHGLILGCSEYFGENVTVEWNKQNQSKTEVEFILTHN